MSMNASSVSKPLVSIVCTTYNQVDYIRDCLKGFLMQDVDFPIEILIHDDCSTDGTTKIIKEYAAKYPEIINPIYEKENQYQQGKPAGNNVWNIPRAKGKYIAFCEGDDFWTDPMKLKRQVDFLESNPDYGLCHTDFNIKNEISGKYTESIFKNNISGFKAVFNSPEEFILHQPYMCPPTWVFRKDIFPSDILDSCDGTFVYFTHYLCTSKVKFLDFTSSTYRIVKESASHSADFDRLYSRMQNILQTKYRLIDHYGLKPEYRKLCLENYYRLNLVDLIIHKKHDDVMTAKKILQKKSIRDKILLLVFKLHLSPLLELARKIKHDRI